ncbi:MAG TPA: isoprenylcysteine carboxylmethyltransferase family protein [Pyrinomonadaceae bacterium]|nr:isoprenylcysteine carboxylmethyltransferase family protein [Pyrinomonadaceae bacterium]HMP64419.1 isoprenylcysteine carboxylmethyltransferase family protein [Pyrinomonadaceae bacterium]
MVSEKKRLLQRFRVPLGFVLAAVFLLLARPTAFTLAVGGGVALVGLLIRAWAAGHIRKYEQLAVTGPYAFTRNPLYLGSFVLAVGFTVAAGVWWLALVTAALFIGIYLPVMRVEEQDLKRAFGADFDEFAKNVPLFLPRLTPWKKDGKMDAGFDFGLYLGHREYQAAIGLVLGLAALVVRMAVFG